MSSVLSVHPCGPTCHLLYTCSECRDRVATHWRCTVCQDYDLCVSCYPNKNHEHPMEKLGLGLAGDSSNQQAAVAWNPRETRRLRIQRCIQSLVHARQCREAACSLPACRKMKRVVQHIKTCEEKISGGCSLCKQVIALCCYHAKHCQENKCPMPFCSSIKQKLRRRQLQHLIEQAQMLHQRMISMQRAMQQQQ